MNTDETFAARPARRPCARGFKALYLACAWIARARQRRQLLELDTRLLRDIGMSADQARHEARKPFWQD